MKSLTQAAKLFLQVYFPALYPGFNEAVINCTVGSLVALFLGGRGYKLGEILLIPKGFLN